MISSRSTEDTKNDPIKETLSAKSNAPIKEKLSKKMRDKEEATAEDERLWEAEKEREMAAKWQLVNAVAFVPSRRIMLELNKADMVWALLEDYRRYWNRHHFDEGRVYESVFILEQNLHSFYDYLLLADLERDDFSYFEMEEHLVGFASSFFSLLTSGAPPLDLGDYSRLDKFSLENVKALFLRDFKLIMIDHLSKLARVKKNNNNRPKYLEYLELALDEAKKCYHELLSSAYLLEKSAQSEQNLSKRITLRDTQMHDVTLLKYLLKMITCVTQILQENEIEIANEDFDKNKYFDRLICVLKNNYYQDYQVDEREKFLTELLSPLIWDSKSIAWSEKQKEELLELIFSFAKEKPILYLNVLFHGIVDVTFLGKFFSRSEDKRQLLSALNDFFITAPDVRVRDVIFEDILMKVKEDRQLQEQIRSYPMLYAILATQLNLKSSSRVRFELTAIREQLHDVTGEVTKGITAINQVYHQLKR